MADRMLNVLRRELALWLEASPAVDGTQVVEGGDVVLSTAKNSRAENQDRALFVRFVSPRKERSFSLMAVLDGIGGMTDGGRCADICISSLITALVTIPRARSRVTIVEALQMAIRDVWNEYKGHGGTTLAAVFVEQGQAYSINIGDSHVYEYRRRGALVQKSADDRLGMQFAKLKGLENVKLNPELSRRLAQYIGMQGAIRTHVAPFDNELFRQNESYMVLATDGTCAQHFTDRKLPEVGIDPRTIARTLIDGSSAVGEADNATVACARAVALQSTVDLASSPFEHLRVCSLHSVFNFLFPTAEGEAFALVDNKRERSRQKRSKPRKSDSPSPMATTPAPASILPEPGKSDIGGAAKPQVTVRQLTFDPIPDEPTE